MTRQVFGMVLAATALAAVGAAANTSQQAVSSSQCMAAPQEAGPSAENQAFVGFLKRVEGEVLVHRAVHPADEPSTIAAELATRLYPLDVVEAGADSAFDIVFTDNSTVSGIAGTCLEVAEYSYQPGAGKGAFELRLERGVIAVGAGSIAGLRDGGMKVRVREDVNLLVGGTRFIVRAE